MRDDGMRSQQKGTGGGGKVVQRYMVSGELYVRGTRI